MQKFRTVEISDPRFERDCLRYITVKTPSLRGRGDICLFAPPEADPARSYPVVILLHGVYGSCWSWAHKAGIHLQVLEMIREGLIPPMFIAMPSDGLWGDGSGYVPHAGLDFEKWIAQDVPALLEQYIDGIDHDSTYFISGLSMGGFGALKIGVKYHERFKAVSAHSAITNLEQMALFVEEDLARYRQQHRVDEDVFNTILKYKNQIPPLCFDCGEGDLLLKYNRDLHHKLSESNVPHLYKEHPGEHEWPYWEKHIRDSLTFFAAQLEVSAKSAALNAAH
jgi:putative tributyrin esterase